jgi:hypothetical protein
MAPRTAPAMSVVHITVASTAAVAPIPSSRSPAGYVSLCAQRTQLTQLLTHNSFHIVFLSFLDSSASSGPSDVLSLSLQAAPSAHAHHCYVLAPFALSFSLAASRVVARPVLATAALALSPCVVSLF